MKRKLLTLIVPLLGAFMGYSQAELTVVAPNGAATTALRAPNGTTGGTTGHASLRGVIIVTAAELAAIPSGTLISKLGFVLSSGATPGPAGGNIQFYLQNTADVTNTKPASWAAITPTMTSVYNGAYNIPVAGGNTDITLTTGFTYTGGSLYVAWDYTGSTFTTTAAVYFSNNSLSGGWRGVYTTALPASDVTTTSAFRPNIRFSFANPFTNELNVSGLVGEKGIFNNTIKTTQTVTSQITNTSQGALSNIPVTLTVTGANPFTATQTISSVAAGGTSTLLFSNVPTINLGAQTLTISIPNDQIPANNALSFTQQVQCDTIGYAQSPVQSGGVGFNTGAGLIANRHTIPANITTYVKSVSNYFPTDVANAGNTIKGILLNGSGTILDSTALITITAGMLGTKQNFDFLNGAIDVSGGVIYVGFRQTANATTGYFPFANQANSYIDPNAAATFALFGGTPAPLGSGLGYMMIDAALTYGGFDVANSATAGTLCANTPLTISPTIGYTNYEFFVDGSSVQNGATATYTTAPLTTTTTYNVDITNGSCVLNSNLETITIVSALINNISDAICSGESYQFGSQTLTAAGSYSQTFVSSAGCDSTVNLTLDVLAPSSSSLSAAICQGDQYAFGGQLLSAAGTYTDVLTNAAGCDSVITLNLSLNPTISVSAAVSAETITATPVGTASTFQWIDCATNMPVSGATSSIFDPTVNGDYAVIVENAEGCSDTSSCVSVNTIGLDELSLAASVSVYPNPALNELHAITTGSQILGYAVMDANGRIVLSRSIYENVKEIQFSVEEMSEGTYLLELRTSEGKVYKPFVKK